MTMAKMGIRALVFDLDGTLVDSELDFAAIRADTGFPEDIGLLEHLSTLPEGPEKDQARAIIEDHELRGARRARWIPGARELLSTLLDLALPCAILTRNSRAALAATHASLTLPDIPLIAREDAAPKPDPEGLLQLAQRWHLAPSSLLYVGDFLFDLQTAANAGSRSALLLSPTNAHYAHQADITFTNYPELATLLGLPKTNKLKPIA